MAEDPNPNEPKLRIGCLDCGVPLKVQVNRKRVRLVCPRCKREWVYSIHSPVMEVDDLPPFVEAHYNRH